MASAESPGTQALRVRLLDGGKGDATWTQDLSTNDGSRVQLAGADGGVAVVVGDELQFLGAADGAVTSTLPLPAAGQDDARPMSTVAGPLVLTWARGTLVARASDLAVLWRVPALGLPTPQASLKARAPKQVRLKAGPAIKVTYTTTSAPNPVTGKRVVLMVDRYEVAKKGRGAVIDLGTPTGVDNVDAYRLMSESFTWL